MPRPRSGSLELRSNGWHARVTLPRLDGTSERRWIPLDTHDKARAKRMLTKIVREVEAGRVLVEAKAEAVKPETVAGYAEAHFAAREARGVAMVPDERMYFRRHVDSYLGNLALVDVRPIHVREVIDAAIKKGLAKGSVGHIHRLLGRIFKGAWRDELIAENPVARVAMPAIREVKKRREVLTDEEVATFLACPQVSLELRMLSLAARVEGGMRTSDLHAWDWTQVDLEGFAWCTVPRSKTGKPQPLEIPAVLGVLLRRWWQRQGSPASGAVFPLRRGPRKGQRKKARGNSYAKRLRDALLVAGVRRHECTRPEDAKPRRYFEPCCPNLARDPLFAETSTTRPVDFHSFRRAFASALAEADVTVQRAMHLTGHSDARVHMNYVMQTRAMKVIPVGAIPQINPESVGVLARACGRNDEDGADDASNDRLQLHGFPLRARTDSNGRPAASKAAALSS